MGDEYKMLTLRSGGLILVALISGCGPRLRHDAKPPAAANIPLAKMVVQVDPSRLDETHKLAADGEVKISGLFFKNEEPQDATVKVALHAKDGVTRRDYVVDLASLKGASAKLEMWDDGTLTILVPDRDDPVPAFETSNKDIKALPVDFPGATQPSTCYLGKDILDMQIRFALCDLGSEKPPSLRFVDAQPDAPPSADAPPAGAAPAAEPAAPVAK
jgi:hypothetical protein